MNACGKVDQDKKNYLICSKMIIEFSNTVVPTSEAYTEKTKGKVLEICGDYGFKDINELKTAHKKYSDHKDSELMTILQKLEGSQTKDIPGMLESADEKSFLTGCKRGDKGRVLYFLDKGVDVNAKERTTGKTGLHLAVEGLHIDILYTLLKKEANPNIKDSGGLSPIILNAKANSFLKREEADTIVQKHIDIAELLLAAGARVNDQTTTEGFNVFATYILYSSGTGPATFFSKKIAQYLLKKGADINARTTGDIDWQDKYFLPKGSSILDLMTAIDDREKTDFLKQNGAKHGTWAKYYLDIKDVSESLPQEVEEKPIKKGKDTEPEVVNKDVDRKDDEIKRRGKSPSEVLIAAYMTGNDGNYSETMQYFHMMSYDTIGASGGLYYLKKIWDEVTRNGNIEKIVILDEKIRGEGATVYFKIYFKDGKKQVHEEKFLKDHDGWKISLSN